MIFHENRLLADNSHGISYLILLAKLGKTWPNLSSAAVLIGALWVKIFFKHIVNLVMKVLKKKTSDLGMHN